METGVATKCDPTSAVEETDRHGRGKEVGPSLNSLAIMRQATTPIDIPSDFRDWRFVVNEGVLLENNTQKFWVDEKLHKNCFLVLPESFYIEWGKETYIEWGEVKRYWRWITVKENCFGGPANILVPRLMKVSWLDIRGEFETSALSPKTEYEVAFVVKLTRNYYGEWPLPVNLELDVPNRPKQIRTENLEGKPKEKWIKLRAGEFKTGPETVGTISFTLHETCQIYKSGLILKGVRIHPKD